MITDHIMASIADLAQEVSQYFVSLQWERLGAMLSYNPSEPLLFSSGLLRSSIWRSARRSLRASSF